MKSLELNWIRNVDKSLVIPEVVFSSISWCGGRYHQPRKDEKYIDGRYYDLSFGLIEISSAYPETIEETLAHEWRHHWQCCHGWEFEYSFDWPETFDAEKYDDMIVRYFTENNHEMDAVKFQYKHSSIHLNWEELLHVYLRN